MSCGKIRVYSAVESSRPTVKTMGGKGKTRTCQQNLLCIVQLYARVIDKLTWKDASPSGPPRQRPGPGPVDFTCLSNNCSHHFLTFSVVQYRPNFSPCLHQTESFPHLQEKAVFIVDQGRRACLIYKATSRQGWCCLTSLKCVVFLCARRPALFGYVPPFTNCL